MMASSHSWFFLFCHYNLLGYCLWTVIQPLEETTGLIMSWVLLFLTTNHTNHNGSTKWGSPFRPTPWAKSFTPTVRGLGLIPQDIPKGQNLNRGYSPRTGTRSKYLHNPWGVILTMEPNHHRRLQDAVGLFFFTTGTTNKQTNNHGYYIHGFKFHPTQHKGFTLAHPNKTGSISQKSAHHVRK